MKTIFILLLGSFLAPYALVVTGNNSSSVTYVLPEEVERVDSFWRDFELLNPNNELVPEMNITYEEELDDGAYRYDQKDRVYVA